MLGLKGGNQKVKELQERQTRAEKYWSLVVSKFSLLHVCISSLDSLLNPRAVSDLSVGKHVSADMSEATCVTCLQTSAFFCLLFFFKCISSLPITYWKFVFSLSFPIGPSHSFLPHPRPPLSLYKSSMAEYPAWSLCT